MVQGLSIGPLCQLLGLVSLFFQFKLFSDGNCLFEVQSSVVAGFLGVEDCVVLLFWFVRSEHVTQMGCQIRIAFWNHTEECCVHWFDKLGLLRNDYRENTNFSILFDQMR